MVKLPQIPEQYIIDGFRGTVDFYVQRGQAIARRWPRKPHHPKTPEQVAQWTLFAWLNKTLPTLDAKLKEAYRWTFEGSALTWRDGAEILFYNGTTEDFDITL